MSRRESVHVGLREASTFPGVEPNRFLDLVTVEIRAFYPPYPQNYTQVLVMLERAYREAVDIVDAFFQRGEQLEQVGEPEWEYEVINVGNGPDVVARKRLVRYGPWEPAT